MSAKENSKKEKMISIIKALFQKTVENGATEDEAMAAAQKAAELMGKYDISEESIRETSSKSESCINDAFVKSPVDERFMTSIASAVSRLCQTTYWKEPDSYAFFGLDHDVEIAKYFFALCSNAIERELERYRRLELALLRFNHRIRKEKSFLFGITERMVERIDEIAESRRKNATGTSLVLNKAAIIKSALDDTGREFYQGKQRNFMYLDKDAYRMGEIAADKVALNDGIESDGDEEKIKLKN